MFFIDLNQKFLFAQNVDISIFNRHQMYNGAFEKILKKPEEILKMAPHSNNNSNSENQEIEEIRKLDIEINKLLQEFHEIIKEFSENQSKISFVKEIIDSKKNNITLDQAFSRLKKDLLRTDEMVSFY